MYEHSEDTEKVLISQHVSKLQHNVLLLSESL